MKRVKNVIFCGIIHFFTTQCSAPLEKADEFKDIEMGLEEKKSDVFKQPDFTHQQISDHLQQLGLHVPENFLIKHLDEVIKNDPSLHARLTQGLQNLDNHKREGSRALLTPGQVLDFIPDKAHLIEFISGAINAEINNNTQQRNIYIKGLMGLGIAGGVSVLFNFLQKYASTGC